MVVHGKTVAEHDRNFHKLLAGLEDKSLTLNECKCTFGLNKLIFMGILLSVQGIGPTAEKVRPVKEAKYPTSASEVRIIQGLIGISTRFIPDFASKAEPLRILCRKGDNFVWGKGHEEAFNTRREDLAGASMLAYLERRADTQGITWAKSGSVLWQ